MSINNSAGVERKIEIYRKSANVTDRSKLRRFKTFDAVSPAMRHFRRMEALGHPVLIYREVFYYARGPYGTTSYRIFWNDRVGSN